MQDGPLPPNAPLRSMNILYVIRQRRGVLLAVFLGLALAYLGYALLFTRSYTAYAQVSDYNSRNAAATPADALTFYLAPLKSDAVVRKVVAGLNETDRQNLLAPSNHWFKWGAGAGPMEIVLGGRQIVATNRLIDIGFTHPDPAVAAKIANLLADEFVKECAGAKGDREKLSMGDMQSKLDAQRAKITGLQKKMQDLATQYDATNLEAGADNVVQSAIQDLNRQIIQFKATMDTLDLRRQQILDQNKDNKPLWDLDFIHSKPNISQLYDVAQSQSNHVQELKAEGYQPEAQAMTEAQGRLDGAMRELNTAINAAVQQLIAELQAAENNYNQVSKRLEELQHKNQDLTVARGTYAALRKQLETENQVQAKMQVALADAETQFNLTDPNYGILAKAEAPDKTDAYPWSRLALPAVGLGAAGDIIVLLGFMVFCPPPKEQLEEYERRRRRHRHFDSSHRRSSSRSSGSSSRSSGSGSRSSSSSSSRSSESSSSSRHRH